MKYRNLRSTAGCLAGTALSLAGASHAETPDEHFYINVVHLFNVTSDVATPGTEFEDNSGMAGYAGYRVLPWLAAEAGYIDFNTINARQNFGSSVQKTAYGVSGYTVGLRAAASFYGLFDVWAGAGVYAWESAFDYEVENAGFPAVTNTGGGSNSSRDLYLRVGAAFELIGGVTATVESSRFKLDDLFYNAGGGTADFDHGYIGLGLKFDF